MWALVPWLNAGANLLLDTGARSAVWEQSDTLLVLSYAAISAAIVITLCGAERIARRVETLPETAAIEGDASTRFREINSVVAPLLLSSATAIAFGLSAFIGDGWTAAMLRGATWFVIGIPFWTFLWTYASLYLGLDRLGRERLPSEAGRVDPSLGLRPLGGLAFMGLWMLLAWLVPVLLTSLPDVVGVVIGVALLSAALAIFFLSMLRLHRQMVDVKSREIAIARELYAQAYEPVHTARTLEALDQQHRLLGAADALEKRAHAIHEWPIDEGTFARVITIATSVVAITVARLILDPLGL